MRKGLISLLALGMVACVTGCSGGASADKPLDECKAEAEKMNVDQLKARVADYEKAIAKHQPEIEKIQKELGTGLGGLLEGKKPENIDELKARLTELEAKVEPLTERMEIYAAQLKAKQAG